MAGRAAASETGGDGDAWLDGDAAAGIACDAAMAPIVTGDVDPGALEDLVRLCVELDRHCRADDAGADADASAGGEPGAPGPGASGPGTGPAWEALEQAVIGKTTSFYALPEYA